MAHSLVALQRLKQLTPVVPLPPLRAWVAKIEFVANSVTRISRVDEGDFEAEVVQALSTQRCVLRSDRIALIRSCSSDVDKNCLIRNG